MKKLLFLIISICLIKIIKGQCFTLNPSSVDECKKQEDSTYRCCYVTYTNNFMNSTYKTICIGVNKTDIKSGHHEETIKKIESGNYTNSNWNETLMDLFRNYSSIDNFDCKGNYISKSLLLFSSLFIFLI